MAVLFCPHCGTQRLAENDLYCRHCGNPYSIPGSESPKPSKQEQHAAALEPSVAELTEIGHGEKTSATGNARDLKTNWLDFWIYVHLPLEVLIGLWTALSSPRSAEALFGIIIIEIPLVGMAISLIVGLRKRKLAAWQLNFLWIVLDVAAMANGRLDEGPATDKLTAFVGYLLLYGLFWGLPNYIYFQKRRVLFTGKPLVEEGPTGLLRTVGRFIWPSVAQQELARRASRQGVYAVAIIAVIQTTLLTFCVLGYPLFGITAADAVDLALFVAIGWGVYKMSRVASVLGILLFLTERILNWGSSQSPACSSQHLYC